MIIIDDSISNEHYIVYITHDSMQSLNTQMLKLGTCIFFFYIIALMDTLLTHRSIFSLAWFRII